jgi:hypothetical protein
MTFAPVLQAVAARMTATPVSLMREDARRWAYALREAVTLVRPDWVLTHHDPALEADALSGLASGDALFDVALAELAPAASAVELTATLAALYPTATIAASITGPGALAGALASGPLGEGVLADLEVDCGDVLAALAAAHVEHGARRILVWETDGDGAALTAAHAAITRRLALCGVDAVLCGAPRLDAVGYAAHALRDGGRGARLIDPHAFASADTRSGDVVITDGPIPADCDMALLRAAGERDAFV